jgi:flagellar FliJ protein
MKRFEFKLQAVLTLRQRAEQAELEKYSRAIQNRQAAADRLTESEMELSEARRQWLNALADGCPAVRAAQMLGFCHLLEERKRQCEQTLNRADVELNQASQRMLLARQQREAVEKFLSRQRERYDRLLREEERKMIDDLVSRRLPVSFSGSGPASGHGAASPSAGENLWN